MIIKKASIEELERILDIVQSSIRVTYPKYYPSEVVEFFLAHHAKEKIEKDILAGNAWSLYVGGVMVGTGSHEAQHVTRVYVAPGFQGQGYGSYIMEHLEAEISRNYNRAELDASLPAVTLYAKRGYRATEYHKLPVENGRVLVYEVMEKRLT